MKTLFGWFLGAFLIVSAPVAAQPGADAQKGPVDPTSVAVARQILTIAFPVEKRSQMFTSIMDSIVEQGRKSLEDLGQSKDKDFQAIIDRSQRRMFDQLKVAMTAALPDYFESFAHAYARDFSPDDLAAILAFAKTPAGQRYFERAPLILKDPDVQASGQRMMAQMLAKMPDIIRENKQDIEDYVAMKAKQEKAGNPKPVT